MKSSCHKIFAWLAYHLGFWQFIFWLSAQLDNKPLVAVFAYHRIVPDTERPEYLQGYEKGLSQENYLRQIEVMSEYFDFIPLWRFYDVVTGEEKPHRSKPLALLTYDDGDSENWDYAFPILKERGFPGVVFIPTAFIETPKRFYHLRVTNALNNFDNGQWEQAAALPMTPLVKAVFDWYRPDYAKFKYEIRRQLIAPMGVMTPQERDELIDQWEAIIGGKYTLGIHPMTWDQIRQLPQDEIEIGSHSVNHNRLVLLPENEVKRELVESKEVLETLINKPVEAICYPEGSYNRETVRLSRKAGYKLGFTTHRELVEYPMSGDSLFEIGRIGAGRGSRHDIIYPIGLQVLKRLLKKSHIIPVFALFSFDLYINELFSHLTGE